MAKSDLIMFDLNPTPRLHGNADADSSSLIGMAGFTVIGLAINRRATDRLCTRACGRRWRGLPC